MTDEPDKMLTGIGRYFQFDKIIAGVASIKFGGGIVGKLSVVLIVVAISITGICWSSRTESVALTGLGIIGFLMLVLGWRMLTIVERNPYTTGLDGAELLMHQQIVLGKKDIPQIPFDPNSQMTNPDSPIPTITLEESKPDEPGKILLNPPQDKEVADGQS